MKIQLKLAAAATALLVATPALAHHSFAMFDREKSVTVQGVVKEFQWTNPHIWLQLAVKEKGKEVVYSIEGSSPNTLARKGWKRTAFKPGDKVTVVLNPFRTGEPGGSFVSATLADGTVLVKN